MAATPATVVELLELGFEVVVDPGAGLASSFPDPAYVEAGATVGDALAGDVVFGVNAPSREQLDGLREGATVVSFYVPGVESGLVEDLARRPITALAMDAVPRISRAQSLDVLSSMANIAGYRAVVEAAHVFGRFFTGQVTAAGKVPPAKVLVAGAGWRVWRRSVRRGVWVRSCGRPTRGPRWPTRCGRWGVSTSRSRRPMSRSRATGYAKEMSEDYNAREPRCMPSRPGTWTSSSPRR